MEPLLLTVTEVAEVLGIGRCAVYDLMRTNRLRSVTIGRSRRIAADEVRRFVDALREESCGVDVAA